MMNLDVNKQFPNQIFEQDFDECVAITVTDIAGNILKRKFNSDFSYAMTLLLQGSDPTTAGSDPATGMDSGIGYGFLPSEEATFTAKTYGELYAANASNYTAGQKKSALQYVLNGQRSILKTNNPYQDIKTELLKGNIVSMPMSWFSSFSEVGSDGIIKDVLGLVSNHNVEICGVVEDAGIERIVGKPWLGEKYGFGGYFKMDERVCNIVCRDAFVYDQTMTRWVSLVRIICKRFPFFNPFAAKLV